LHSLKESTNWYVYILRCADNTLYTGITKDINKRIAEHNRDSLLAARYTRGRRPVKLVYQETATSRSQATKRELQIKKMRKELKENLVKKNNSGESKTL